MEIPFVGGAYKGRSLNLNSQECQNLFPVLDPLGKKVKALFGTAGLSEFVSLLSGLLWNETKTGAITPSGSMTWVFGYASKKTGAITPTGSLTHSP